MTYREAVRGALRGALKSDPRFFLMGERRVNNDVTELAGIFPAKALEKAR